MENQTFIEAVNQIIQRRLALSNSNRTVHLHSQADMGVEIEIEGKVYSDLSEIDDNAIRELIQTSIQEWETEQNISESSIWRQGIEAEETLSPEEPIVPMDLEDSLKNNWLNIVAANLVGALAMGVCGGGVAGFVLYSSSYPPDDVLTTAGVIGGASGGIIAGNIQLLRLRQHISHPRIWVIICSVAAAMTWAIATGWAWDRELTAEVIGKVEVWVVAGILFGAVGGFVSGILQFWLLRQHIPRIANWWPLTNIVGWATGGAVFLPALWVVFLGLVGGGNPGSRADKAIAGNLLCCGPTFLLICVIVMIWVVKAGQPTPNRL